MVVKPGWSPPQFKNPDSYIKQIVMKGNAFHFLNDPVTGEELVGIKLELKSIGTIKASLSDKIDHALIPVDIAVSYNAKTFYIPSGYVCYTTEKWVGLPRASRDKALEDVRKANQTFQPRGLCNIVVDEIKPRLKLYVGTGYLHNDFTKYFEGSGSTTWREEIKVNYVTQRFSITVGYDSNSNKYYAVPEEGRTGIDVVFKLPKVYNYQKDAERFKLIFGVDPYGYFPIELVDKYAVGDWPEPTIDVKPAGQWTPDGKPAVEIKLAGRGGAFPRKYGDLSSVTLIVKQAFSRRDLDLEGYGQVLVKKDLYVTDENGGKVVEDISFASKMLPGYYKVRVEKDWGGYIAYDEEVITVGAPPPETPLNILEVGYNRDFDKNVLELKAKWAGGDKPYRLYIDWGDSMKDEKQVDGTEAMLSHQYQSEGTYTVAVKVVDSMGRESNWKVKVEMVKPKKDANVAIGGGSTSLKAGQEYSLGVSSTGGANVVVDWGDGSKTTHVVGEGAQSISKHFEEEGSYKVKAEAFDKYGNKVAEKTFDVNVEGRVTLLQMFVEKVKNFLERVWSTLAGWWRI
ncbi:MAG: hypothetical protein QXI42_10045 [Thermoproteota archaeon]